MPLENIAAGQSRCEIYNSTLSEAGVLGFEYGYSVADPAALDAVLREGGGRAAAIADPIVAETERLVGFLRA